jgi:regulator of replication initiation timing
MLALFALKDVEQRLILDAEAARLQRAATAATAERNDRTTQQLQAALEENRQLKLELDDVRKRLDTITSIERSIRERENGPNTQ